MLRMNKHHNEMLQLAGEEDEDWEGVKNTFLDIVARLKPKA